MKLEHISTNSQFPDQKQSFTIVFYNECNIVGHET
jgi:hypothetical protein